MEKQDFYEFGSDATVVYMEADLHKCQVQVHATPIDALTICGAMVSSCIGTYFKLAKQADIDKATAIIPLKIALEKTFDDLDIDATIELEER